jgi:hypothetical protein
MPYLEVPCSRARCRTSTEVAGHQQRVIRRAVHGLVQTQDIGGVILAIAIQGRYPGCPRRLHPAADGSALSATAAMAQHAQPGMLAATGLQHIRGIIGAAVIHHDDLVIKRSAQTVAHLAYE